MVLRLGPGRDIEVGSDELVIGRDEACDLTLDDPKASRRHAAVRAVPDGRLELRDLGTTNGTFVNEQRIEGTATLGGGERVRVGRTTIEVVAEGGGARTALDAGAGAAGAAAASEPAPAEPAERKSEPGAETGDMPAAPDQVARPVRPSVIERIKLRKAVNRATILGGVAVVLAVSVAVLFVTGVFGGGEKQKTTAEIVEQVGPSTVAVLAVDDKGEVAGRGTGWVYDAGQGLIVTNAHVVNGGTQFKVGLGDKAADRRDAQVVGSAPCEDIAVLKMSDAKGLKTLPLDSQSNLKTGQEVVAVGYPGTAREFGSPELTATTGVVSNVKTRFDLRGADVPVYPNVVQTDTAINPGNSGGPLVDFDAKLVGINSSKSPKEGTENQNYAIGVDRVKEIVPTLVQGKSIGWTGLNVEFPDPASLAEQDLPPGLLVTGAVPGTPAANAGLGEQALLVAVNGQPMDATLPGYCDVLKDAQSGQAVSLTLVNPDGTKADVQTQVK